MPKTKPKPSARTRPPTAERGPQKRGERTRRSILEAALRLIARRGLGSVTFREVATEAGVSLGVTTYHFGSRADLLAAAFALHLEQTDTEGLAFTRALEHTDRDRPPSLEEFAQAVVSLLRHLVIDERDSFMAGHELTLELGRDSELASRIQEVLSAHRGEVTGMVAMAGSEEPELDGEVLSATLEGLALKWLAHPDDPAYEDHLLRVVRHLLKQYRFAASAAALTALPDA